MKFIIELIPKEKELASFSTSFPADVALYAVFDSPEGENRAFIMALTNEEYKLLREAFGDCRQEKPSSREITLETVLRVKELELARERAERALVARDIASLESQLAEEELRFWELRDRNELTKREIALRHYLKTGRQDHLDKFESLGRVYKVTGPSRKDVEEFAAAVKGDGGIDDLAHIVGIDRIEGESDEELQARIDGVKKDLFDDAVRFVAWRAGAEKEKDNES